MKAQEVKHVEGAMLVRLLRNGLLICGCLLLIPAFNINFTGALSICMIIYSLNLDEF